jgi:hypothetical protein
MNRQLVNTAQHCCIYCSTIYFPFVVTFSNVNDTFKSGTPIWKVNLQIMCLINVSCTASYFGTRPALWMGFWRDIKFGFL